MSTPSTAIPKPAQVSRPAKKASASAWGDEEGKGKAKRALNEETIAIGKESKANAIGKNLADMMPSADEVKPAKEKTRFWTTRAMLDKDTASTKEVVKATFRELIVFLVFLTVTCLISFGMTTPTHYYYTNAFETLLVNSKHSGGGTFESISSVDDVWKWVEGPLISGLFPTEYYNGDPLPDSPGNVLEDSKLLGAPRIRQAKVSNTSCIEQVPEAFANTITECYAKYHLADEYKEPIYPQETYGLIPRVKTNLTEGAWEWRDEEETGTAGPIPGKYSGTKYYGSGYTINLPRNASKALETVEELKDLMWIDQGSRAMWVDFTAYNGNVNLFMSGRLFLEFPPTGGVMASYRFLTLKLIRYVTGYDYFLLAMEGLFIAFTLWYTFEEIVELKVTGWNVFKKPWELLDWLILFLSYVAIAFNVFRHFFVLEKLATALESDDDYANFDRLAYWQSVYNTMSAFMLFFIWIKTFNFLDFNYTMTLLSRTLSACVNDILGYLVMFGIVFIAYAQFGYLVFGPTTFGFHTFEDSTFSLLRIILGDFDFYALYKANRAVGPIFFFTYVISVFFILFNVFLAIINDSYVEVKAQLEHSEYENEMGTYISEIWTNFKNKFRRKQSLVTPASGEGTGNTSNAFGGDEESAIGGASAGADTAKTKLERAVTMMSAVDGFKKKGTFTGGSSGRSSSMRKMSMDLAEMNTGMNQEMNTRMIAMEERVGSIADKVERLLVAMGNIEIAQARMQKRASQMVAIDEEYDSDEDSDQEQSKA